MNLRACVAASVLHARPAPRAGLTARMRQLHKAAAIGHSCMPPQRSSRLSLPIDDNHDRNSAGAHRVRSSLPSDLDGYPVKVSVSGCYCWRRWFVRCDMRCFWTSSGRSMTPPGAPMERGASHAESVQGRGVAVGAPPELISSAGGGLRSGPEIGEWPRRWTALAAYRRAAPAVRRQTGPSRPQGPAAGIPYGVPRRDQKIASELGK